MPPSPSCVEPIQTAALVTSAQQKAPWLRRELKPHRLVDGTPHQSPLRLIQPHEV